MKYVIHTVGPVWHGGSHNEAELLASVYRESLKIATAYKVKSISFPSISTGVYHYPVTDAAKIAIDTTISYLCDNSTPLEEVLFVLCDANIYSAYSATLAKQISN